MVWWGRAGLACHVGVTVWWGLCMAGWRGEGVAVTGAEVAVWHGAAGLVCHVVEASQWAGGGRALHVVLE